jgi:hypothetical protein
MIVPVYLSYYVVTGTVGVIAAILLGLRSALAKAGWTTYERIVTVSAATVTVIGWFFLAIALASADAFGGAADRIPTTQYGILVPILIGGLLIWRSPRLARIIDAVPQHWLIGVQLYRALGVIFLILYAVGKLPGAFAWPAGLGDVLVGVLAPVVAIAYWRGPQENADLVLGWNLFGLADLVVAVAMGFVTSPSPFQLIAFDLPNELISRFPLVLVPVFLVPVSVLLHLASLAKLRRGALRDHDRGGIARVGA